jgi:hypothetical protein
MKRVGEGEGKMERYCSTGQSPQRAVAPTEEEELKLTLKAPTCFGVKHHNQGAHYLSLAKVTIVKMS